MQKIMKLFDVFYHHQREYPGRESFNFKTGGKWNGISIEKFINQGNIISSGLIRKGIVKNDTILLVSNNRLEWHLIDFAVSQIGAVLVPLYQNLTIKEYKHVLVETEARIGFVSGKVTYELIKKASENVKNIFEIFVFNEIENATNYKELFDVELDLLEIEKRKNSIHPDDLATIIYTSGTEGIPKGVMLSHNNIVSNILATQKILNLNSSGVALSFLPLNHIYEKIASYVFIYTGIKLYYGESLAQIIENAKEVQPTIMTCVPLLIKKICEKIIEKGSQLKGIRKIIFNWSLILVKKWDVDKVDNFWYNSQRSILDRLVYSKWREVLGGRIKIIASGSAAINPFYIKMMHCAGVSLIEGYGLTETSPIVSLNHVDYKNFKLGTVGPVIDEVQVKLAEDGEILVKGPNVMMGYFKQDKKTKEVLSEDKWFATGDIGQIIENKYLKIVDRKKEIFKTLGGKYIAPQVIEEKIKEHPLIENCIVIGENKDVVGAILQPNWTFLENWCKENSIDFVSNESIIKDTKAIQFIRKIIEDVNLTIAPHERVRRFELIPDVWSVSNGDLTPTLKLKRKIILAKYSEVYNLIFPN